jgi:hypothetical protein
MVDGHDPGEVARTLEQADALVDAGLATDAIRVLTDANRATPSPAFETRLVDVRHLAFAPGTPTASTPPPRVTARPEPPGPLLPLTAADLTPARLRAEMAEHGCVYVRGLVGRDRIAELRAGIDRALEGFDATDGAGGSTAPWYEPFRPRPEYQVVGKRNWVRASGAVWTVDSPRMLFALTELVEDSGIAALITDYLGERPALSANKCTLRRVHLVDEVTPAGAEVEHRVHPGEIAREPRAHEHLPHRPAGVLLGAETLPVDALELVGHGGRRGAQSRTGIWPSGYADGAKNQFSIA